MDEGHKVLSLKDAYRFGEEYGLQQEVIEIRDMEIEWDLSYTSSLRRGYVVDLFTKKQLMEAFNAKYWPAGNTGWGRRRCEFWLGLKHRYEDFLDGRGDEAIDLEEAEEEQAFAAETHLRDFLANNLSCVEPELRLYREGERSGVEFAVDNGRIDVLAVDRFDRFVVFELKVARGRNKALGQLLYYMGWVDKKLGGGPCRGIIVAREISDDLVLAAQRVQDVTLYRYKLSFAVERAS
jgi:hypothetical protein